MSGAETPAPWWRQVLEGTVVAVLGQFGHFILTASLGGVFAGPDTRHESHQAWLVTQERLHTLLVSPGFTQLLWVPLAAWYLVRQRRAVSAGVLGVLAFVWLVYNAWHWSAWRDGP